MSKKNLLRVSLFFNAAAIIAGAVIFLKQGGWVYLANGPSKVAADQPKENSVIKIKKDSFEVNDKQSKEVVFAGDSHTDHFEWGEYFDGITVANRGISGDTSDGLLKRIDQVTELNPQKVFLMIGINDIQQNIPVETIEKNYKKIIQKIKEANPKTQIYVQSVFPVAGEMYENNQFKRSKPVNEAVVELNKKLAQLEDVTFLDVADRFGSELPEEYSIDGLHFSKEGYEIWLSEIEEYVKE